MLFLNIMLESRIMRDAKEICTYNILDGEQFVSCSGRESWF